MISTSVLSNFQHLKLELRVDLVRTFISGEDSDMCWMVKKMSVTELTITNTYPNVAAKWKMPLTNNMM